MLKIYGQARSRTFRVLWMAGELGIPYEHVPVGIGGGEGAECRSPWFLAINPNGRVPAIDDDGFRLWESMAINLYLARKHASPLCPRTPKDEARMLQWAFFAVNDLEPRVVAMFQHRVAFPEKKRHPAVADEAEAGLQPKLAILEAELGRQRTLAGDAWGLADFLVASVLATLELMRYDLACYPHLAAWLQASLARPAAQAARAMRETENRARVPGR